jgi:hypothetical protein
LINFHSKARTPSRPRVNAPAETGLPGCGCVAILPKPDEPKPISLLYAPARRVSSGGVWHEPVADGALRDRIAGVPSCYDRVVITGTVPVICYAEGMTRFLYANGIRIFDYPRFAQTLRDRVRDRAAALVSDAGLTIEHIAKSHIRKEEVVARVLAQRGDHPGLVHVILAMEATFLIIPIVGAFFIDIINAVVLTLFLSLDMMGFG